MNVSELFEGKVSPAWRKKFEARIVLAGSYEAKVAGGDKNISSDAWAATLKQAKATFAKLVEDHPDGLCFATYKEAVDHMASMEYPNWPLKIEKRTGWGKTRSEPLTIDFKDATLDDIQIEKLENGRHLVSIQAKSGPALSEFLRVFYGLYKKKRWSKDGKTELRAGSWRGNAFQTDATEKQIRAAIDNTKDINAEKEERKAVEASPEFKKQKNKEEYAYRKEKKILDDLNKKNRKHYAAIVRDAIDEVWPKSESMPSVNYFNTPSFASSPREITVNIHLTQTEKSPLADVSDDPGVQKRLQAIHDKKYGNFNDMVKKLADKLKTLDNVKDVKKYSDRHDNELSVTFDMIE